MGSDGVRGGYDLEQLAAVRAICAVPLVASGGAGEVAHFTEVFDKRRRCRARGECLSFRGYPHFRAQTRAKSGRHPSAPYTPRAVIP